MSNYAYTWFDYFGLLEVECPAYNGSIDYALTCKFCSCNNGIEFFDDEPSNVICSWNSDMSCLNK